MTNKIKTTGFWLSLTGAIILVLQQLGQAFGFSVNSDIINGIVSAVCGVMVVLGVLIPTKNKESENNNNLDENNDESNNV